MTKIGYIRVSTDDQTTARQIDGLRAVCDEVVTEHCSAAKDRPAFQKTIRRLRKGDSFVIYDLDRAFRSTVDALTHAEMFRTEGVHFQIVSLNIDTATAEGELYYTMIAAFARFERRILARRTREGMEAAKRRGQHVGRPSNTSVSQLRRAKQRLDRGDDIDEVARHLRLPARILLARIEHHCGVNVDDRANA